jgi:hypothetical protein
MATACAFLRLPNDLFDPTTAGFYVPGRVNHLKYLCLHSNIFKSLFSQNSCRVASRADREEVVNSVVSVLNQVQSIGHLVVELASDPMEPSLMEAFLGVVEKAKIREIHIVEHTNHNNNHNVNNNSNTNDEKDADVINNIDFPPSMSKEQPPPLTPAQKERNSQLAKLGKGMRRNSTIQKICIWDGPIILSHIAPSPTLKELDVSLVDARITNAVIDALPQLTNLRKLVLQTSELVGLPPAVPIWKAALMKAISQCPVLQTVSTDGRMPVFSKEDRVKLDGWIKRNETLRRWQEGRCRPPSCGLLPKLLERVATMSMGNDIIYNLLAGEAACHTHLLVNKQQSENNIDTTTSTTTTSPDRRRRRSASQGDEDGANTPSTTDDEPVSKRSRTR